MSGHNEMPVRNTTRAGIAIFLGLLITALAGCDIGKSVPYTITSHDTPTYKPSTHSTSALDLTKTSQNYPGTSDDPFGAAPVAGDPMLKGLPEPFQDPYLGSSANQTDPNDNLPIETSDPLISRSRPKNWYWLRGRIENGEVAIFVNGRPVGRYSVRIDHEITDNLVPGFNTITFQPLPDTTSEPVYAHIVVTYAQQAPDQAPVLTYDTEKLAERQALLDVTPKSLGLSAKSNEPTYTKKSDFPKAEVMQMIAH